MHDDDRLDPADGLSDETFRKAEELCSRLSSSLSIDKRGEAVFFSGAVKLLDTPAEREYLVTVCDVNGQPWFTLIGDEAVPASGKALLVFKSPLIQASRYLGTVGEPRPGLRTEDHGERFFSIYEPREDVRHHLKTSR
ncbi:MAG TPA: hypothetical protein VKO38_04445 [Wenzhouxiangella sp.]|nr:hypothetical protein [Wenzhouxiangella sp.]